MTGQGYRVPRAPGVWGAQAGRWPEAVVGLLMHACMHPFDPASHVHVQGGCAPGGRAVPRVLSGVRRGGARVVFGMQDQPCGAAALQRAFACVLAGGAALRWAWYTAGLRQCLPGEAMCRGGL